MSVLLGERRESPASTLVSHAGGWAPHAPTLARGEETWSVSSWSCGVRRLTTALPVSFSQPRMAWSQERPGGSQDGPWGGVGPAAHRDRRGAVRREA